jgi:hypothetical protein
VAKWSEAKVYGRLLAGIAVSNPAAAMNVRVLCVLYSKGQKAKQDNQDKEVQIKYREQTKKPRRGHGYLSVVSVLCLSGRCPCDGPITRPEELYRLYCVIVCDLETS